MSAVVIEQIIGPELIADLLAIGETKMVLIGNAERKRHRYQVPNDFPEAEQVAELVIGAVENSMPFQLATYPEICSPPRLCAYAPGMGYRDHLDVPQIGEDRVRTDVSVTICLSDGATYQGGELVIDSDRVERRWKGRAGDCLVYSGDSIHRVEPVTHGLRVVCIFWIQSLVREAAKRRILYDLSSGFSVEPASPAELARAELMQRCHGNLLRLWAGR